MLPRLAIAIKTEIVIFSSTTEVYMSIPANRSLFGSYTDVDGLVETYTYSLNDFRDAYSTRAKSAGPLSLRDRRAFEELTLWMMFTPEMKDVDPATYTTVLDLHLDKIMLDVLARDDFYVEHWVRSYSLCYTYIFSRFSRKSPHPLCAGWCA